MKRYLPLFFLLISARSFTQFAGALDPTFSTDGKTSISVDVTDYTVGMALQSDGKIIAGTVSTDGFSNTNALVRFNSDGSVDNSFGDNGILEITFTGDNYGYINSVCVAENDKIIIGCIMYTINFQNYYTCLRYNSDGTPDDSFGNNGMAVTPVDVDGFYGGMLGITLAPDGSIIEYGATSTPGNADFVVFRLDEDGVFDTNFGESGYAILEITPYGDFINKIKFISDNKIVIAGYSEIPSGDALDPVYDDIAMARLLPDGTPDSNFGNAGVVAMNLSGAGDALKDIAFLDDGSFYAGGYLVDTTDSDTGLMDFLLCKFDSEGNLDDSFDDDGWMRKDLGNTYDLLSNLLLDDSGRLILAGYTAEENADHDYCLVRLMEDGSTDSGFGNNGIVITDMNGSVDDITSALIQPDGKILVGGNSHIVTSNDIALARYFSETVTGVGEIQSADGIAVFPVPAHSCINWKTSDPVSSIAMHDVNGSLVSYYKINSFQGNIAIADLAPGFYFLKFEMKDGRIVSKRIDIAK